MKKLEGRKGGGPTAGSSIRYCSAKMNPRPRMLLAVSSKIIGEKDDNVNTPYFEKTTEMQRN
jgi:hypothetical protein